MQNDDETLFLASTQSFDAEDYATAFRLFSQAAQQGEAWAQNYLGIMYSAGLGVDKDQRKSLMYHKLCFRTSKSVQDCANIGLQYEIMGDRRRALY